MVSNPSTASLGFRIVRICEKSWLRMSQLKESEKEREGGRTSEK